MKGDPVISELFLTTYGLQVDKGIIEFARRPKVAFVVVSNEAGSTTLVTCLPARRSAHNI